MKALNHPFELTADQKKHRALFDLAMVGALFILTLILVNLDIDEGLLDVLLLVELGAALGVTVRHGTQRGWMYYAEKYRSEARYEFTKSLKIGVLWRALVVCILGRIALALLVSSASSEVGQAAELLIGFVVIVTASHRLGLRFGWQSADNTLMGAQSVNATP